MHARTLLNRDNYDFALIGFESSGVEPSGKGGQYVLAVSSENENQVPLPRQNLGGRDRFRRDPD